VNRLRDQIAVVTGSSGGIGGAIAVTLAREGSAVYLLGRNRAKLDSAASRMRSESLRAESWPLDLTSDEDLQHFRDHLAVTTGRVDILVHCAGYIDHGPLSEAPLASLDYQYATNLRGPLKLTQLLLPMLKKPRGQIVLVNSSAGLTAKANAGHHSAMQHAFKGLADALREEVNAENVRVTSIFPGRTATSRTAELFALENRDYRPDLMLQPEDVAAVVSCTVTLPWTAEVTNITVRPMRKSY
jgi:short-subunit dehydrogenase